VQQSENPAQPSEDPVQQQSSENPVVIGETEGEATSGDGQPANLANPDEADWLAADVDRDGYLSSTEVDAAFLRLCKEHIEGATDELCNDEGRGKYGLSFNDKNEYVGDKGDIRNWSKEAYVKLR